MSDMSVAIDSLCVFCESKLSPVVVPNNLMLLYLFIVPLSEAALGNSTAQSLFQSIKLMHSLWPNKVSETSAEACAPLYA